MEKQGATVSITAKEADTLIWLLQKAQDETETMVKNALGSYAEKKLSEHLEALRRLNAKIARAQVKALDKGGRR